MQLWLLSKDYLWRNGQRACHQSTWVQTPVMLIRLLGSLISLSNGFDIKKPTTIDMLLKSHWKKEIKIIIIHIHHHIVPLARISLTLSRHFSLSFIASGRSSGLHPVFTLATECMFVLVVLLLPGHMWGSIGVYHLWTSPCFSSSVLHVWFV